MRLVETADYEYDILFQDWMAELMKIAPVIKSLMVALTVKFGSIRNAVLKSFRSSCLHWQSL